MKKLFPLLLVALLSSLFTIALFKLTEEEAPVVQPVLDDAGSARYTSLVNQLFEARTKHGFRSSSPTDFIEAASVATPAVVNIRAIQEVGSGLWGRSALAGSSGSGVVMSPDGYVVTNHHVVENSQEIKVTLSDKRTYQAKLIGSDPSTDIALLKIDAIELPFMIFGNSDSVLVGEWVLAVGNPFNLESTVTAGIVSAKGRNINILGGGASIESFIQTDAAVNPGNSGGALVNTAGELIGINTAIITESGSYEGYSFAVPSNLVQKIIRDLREFGRVQRAFLGVGIEDVDGESAQELGLPNADGVYINRVSLHSAAEDAGLQVGDVILSINGTTVRSTPELQEQVGRFRPGEMVRIEFWRNRHKMHATMRLKDAKNSTSIARVNGDELSKELGIELRNMSREEQLQTRLRGVVVSSVRRGSLVYETNMQPGFIITSVNGSIVNNMAEAIDGIKNAYNNVILDGYYQGEDDLYSYRFKKH
ncbi:MAG: Do family serine endopeptidase [Saprospiraceae bacterium]|jgi:Do/DeqQ family serine protease